ncbi:MAG: hypothetical protein R3C12_21900 [Planctomycetaceae bacterium]
MSNSLTNLKFTRATHGSGWFHFCLAFLLLPTLVLFAQEAEEQGAGPPAAEQNVTREPLARYLVVNSPVDDNVFRSVRNTAISLQEQAVQEDRTAVLILEIRPGQSEFHQVYGLAQFLSSARANRLTTIAWVPETVTGNNVVVALGCKEIVLHPDALLGDIGRGKPVDASEEQSILSLVNKRHNLQVNNDLVLGLLNPDVSLLQITLERDGVSEKRVVTEQQAKVLRDNQLVITDVEVIKDKGKPGLFSGKQARELGLLVSHTVNQQAELAEIYRIDPQNLKAHLGSSGALPGTPDRCHADYRPRARGVYRSADRAGPEGRSANADLPDQIPRRLPDFGNEPGHADRRTRGTQNPHDRLDSGTGPEFRRHYRLGMRRNLYRSQRADRRRGGYSSTVRRRL